MKRVHLEALLPAAQPAQLAIELAVPERHLQVPTAAVSTPSWRETPAEKPAGATVIEIELT